MSDPVSTIRNLGPASVASFARAGIHTAAELRALGADAAYLALLSSGARPHFIGYYVLVLGLQGRPWNDLEPEEKATLRVTFDALCAQAAAGAPGPASDRARLDATLREIGVFDPDD